MEPDPGHAGVKAVAAHDVRMLDLGLIRKGENTGFYAYWTGEKLGSDQPRWGDDAISPISPNGGTT